MFTISVQLPEGICPHPSPGTYLDIGNSMPRHVQTCRRWEEATCAAWVFLYMALLLTDPLGHSLSAHGWETLLLGLFTLI